MSVSYADAVGKIYHTRLLKLSRNRLVNVIARVKNPTVSLIGITKTLEELPLCIDNVLKGLTIIILNMHHMQMTCSYGLYQSTCNTIYLANDAFTLPTNRKVKWIAQLYDHYYMNYSDYITQFVLLHELGHANNHKTRGIHVIKKIEESRANVFALLYLKKIYGVVLGKNLSGSILT